MWKTLVCNVRKKKWNTDWKTQQKITYFASLGWSLWLPPQCLHFSPFSHFDACSVFCTGFLLNVWPIRMPVTYTLFANTNTKSLNIYHNNLLWVRRFLYTFIKLITFKLTMLVTFDLEKLKQQRNHGDNLS